MSIELIKNSHPESASYSRPFGCARLTVVDGEGRDPLKALILFGALLLSGQLSAAQLDMQLGQISRTWQTEDLLTHPQLQVITVKSDVAYKKDMTYYAVPLSALLTGIKPSDHLQAVALDGFAAELAAAPLLNDKGARAWLAIEDPAHPWPPLAAGRWQTQCRAFLPSMDRPSGWKYQPRAMAVSSGQH